MGLRASIDEHLQGLLFDSTKTLNEPLTIRF